MYSDCLVFLDLCNFDGFGFSGGPVVIFRLKKAIKMDELYQLRFFKFQEKSMVNGKPNSVLVNCRIKGLRHPKFA